LPQSREVHLSIQDPYLDISKHPCPLSLWREVPRWAGWKSLSESGFPKAPLWCQQLTRGVCNNIADSLVKVRGSGVKVRSWTPPFGSEISKSFSLFWRSPSHGAQPLGLPCFMPEFTPGRAGPPSPPPAPKLCKAPKTD